MKLSLPPKLVEKLVWVPVILLSKTSFPVTRLMPNYVETGRSHPLNHDILQITLIHTGIEKSGDQKRGMKEGIRGSNYGPKSR
jgi:hypothetical protein